MAEIDLTQFDGHTAGPWRWEYNAEHRSVHVVGGRPLHDLTVMDFARWGMGGATPVFRDVAEDGMNIMHKLNSRPDWVAPFKGRQHHARWCSAVVHPDAILMAAAPALLAEVKRQAAEIERLRGRCARDIVAYRVQIKPCRCGPDGCADSGCPGRSRGQVA